MINIKKITKTFNTPFGKVDVLKDVSLNIEKGDIFGIIGFSGAGKSTLIRCLNCLESPDSGEVYIGNKEISSLSNKELRSARKKIGMIPFLSRVVESSLKEVDYGKIEAAIAMGANPIEIIFKVLIPEGLPSLIRGYTLSIISVIGCTALAGSIGAGGLGSVAIRYGYQRFQTDYMIVTIIILVILVQGIQLIGDVIAKRINKKRFKLN